MFRLALCDDNRYFLEILSEQIQKYCSEHGKPIVIRKFADSGTLVDLIEKDLFFDAYFLDIEMREYSGMELAQIIRNRAKKTPIFFLTAYPKYAIRACGMNIQKYILKEKLEEEIPKALEILFVSLEKLKDEKAYIISNRQRYIRFFHKDIVYIYRNERNATFVLVDGTEIADRFSLQDVLHKMDDPDMIMLDRGTILNLYHVDRVTGKNVLMDNGYEVTTNRTRIHELKNRLNQYWRDLI